MFDPPRERWHLPSWQIKLIAISACALGIGLGLCGLDAHLYPHAEFGGSLLAFFGAALMVLAALGLAVVVLILLVRLVALMFPK